jgi:S1-C subfamily serine protease
MGASASALPPDRFFAKTSPSVWRVFVFDARNVMLGQGSAVVVGKETLLTNCHVVARAAGIIVKHDNVSYDAMLQYADPQRDMCQLTVRGLSAPAVDIGDADTLAVGQKVYALGNPKGMELTLSDGLVSALRKDGGKLEAIQTTAPISPGSSGGGLFDEEGRLIGITTMQIKEAQNLNFAVPINWLRDLPARSEAGMARMKALAAERTEDKREPTRESTPQRRGVQVVASGYADINDVDKLPMNDMKVRASYRKFLERPLPRAFALSDNGGTWVAWSGVPHDKHDSPDPAVRVLSGCEKYYQSRCRLYAVDNVVVYKPNP